MINIKELDNFLFFSPYLLICRYSFTIKSREKIVALLSEDGKLSAVALAKKIGISAKSVEKHLANLKADGIIQRIGPAKGGHWKVSPT